MKTIHDAATERSIYYESNPYCDFTAGVKFAQEWISVEDELPLESVDEILIKDDESTLVAVYRFGKFNTGFSFEFNPTHWRPIERE